MNTKELLKFLIEDLDECIKHDHAKQLYSEEKKDGRGAAYFTGKVTAFGLVRAFLQAKLREIERNG